MFDLGDEPKYDPRNMKRAQSSTLAVYMRLLRYAWQYKARLFVSIIFAFVVAASISSMVLVVAPVVNVIFWEPDGEAAAQVADENPDPAANYITQAEDWDAKAAGYLGWENPPFAAWAATAVTWMRDDSMRALSWLAGLLVILAFIGGLARFLQEYFGGSIGANISVDVGAEMYENVLGLSMDFFEKQTSGELLARFTNDIFMINRGIASVLVKVLREPIKAIAFLALALSIDPVLTLLGVCVLPPVAMVIVRIGKKVKKSVRRSLEKIASMASVINETFNGIAIIKGYSMERYEIARLNVEIQKLKRYLLQMVRADALVGPLTEFILVLGIVIFVLVSGAKVERGDIFLGDLLALYMYLALMLDPVRKLSSVNNMIQTSVAAAERVFDFIDAKPTITEAPDAVAIAPIRESLHFDDVHFSYTGSVDVLKGVTVDIRHGEMVAIVGFSGAGKSTLIKLIPRFYDVTAGAITVDGVDIRKATFKSLRDQIGIVPQDTILFNLTVRDNIAFGKTDFTDEDVVQAAKAAYAHDFIMKLPNGYDTVIGESGATLSGGQRQRLSLARALVKNPSILILDEATSSLDSESEQAIQRALAEFVRGRTTMVIAHRLSTIKQADRILVLDDGNIAEQGTHQELLREGGIYRRLYETQLASQDEEGAA